MTMMMMMMMMMRKRRKNFNSIIKYIMAHPVNFSFPRHFLIIRQMIALCDITARTVILYVQFNLTYMYCTVYTAHCTHCTCFPVSHVCQMLKLHLTAEKLVRLGLITTAVLRLL